MEKLAIPEKIHPEEAQALLRERKGTLDKALTAQHMPGVFEIFGLRDGRMLEIYWLPRDAYEGDGQLAPSSPVREIGEARLYASREALLVWQQEWKKYDPEAVLVEWERTDWGKMRGVRHSDYNNALVLVRATVEEVAQALMQELGVLRWEQDILGREIEVTAEGLFVFRMQGHTWTEILDPFNYSEAYSRLSENTLRTLSARLNTRVIAYGRSDTVDCTDYALFEAGELLEEFAQEGDECVKFESRLRVPTRRELYYVYDFVDAFFREQDALEPGISGDYFFNYVQPQPGARVTIQNPGFALISGKKSSLSVPQIERVDYVSFS